jgi:hypothetical protein
MPQKTASRDKDQQKSNRRTASKPEEVYRKAKQAGKHEFFRSLFSPCKTSSGRKTRLGLCFERARQKQPLKARKLLILQ